MTYPGNRELSAQAQERVLTAFRQAVRKLQEGGREEAIIALEFVLRLDPAFAPARDLQRQLESGSSEIDLSGIISQLQATGSEESDQLLVSAVEDFNERRFLESKTKVERVLIDLPGHPEARQLLRQIETALKSESQVAQYLTQAREALDAGDGKEAANFVMMAQAVDPHHPGISAALEEIQDAGVGVPALETFKASEPEAGPTVGAFDAPDYASGPTIGGFDGPGAESQPAPVSFDALDEGSAPSFDTGPDPYVAAREPSGGFDAAPPESGTPQFDFATADAGEAGAEEGQPDIADLFATEEGEQPAAPDEEVSSGGADDDERNIEKLLRSGQDAFDTGDYHQAIDTWSRIFLIDPDHGEARQAIEQARRRDEEIGERVGQLMKEAEEARDTGQLDLARRNVHDVLSLRPNHIEAFDLKEQLDSGEATVAEATPASSPPPPPPPAGEVSLDGLDLDMFEESAAEEEVARGDLFTAADYATPPEPELTSGGQRKMPMLQIGFGVVALLVVALGIWFGSRMLSGNREASSQQALERTLARAEELFKGGHPEEAIRLLQGYQASDLDRGRIEERVARYRRALVPPTPTPVPEQADAAQKAYNEGRWLAAYELVEAGIAAHPHDRGLVELRDRIGSQERRIPALVRARQKSDYETATNLARELLSTYPDQEGLRQELKRDLFDLAASELRSYNLTGAEGHLRELLQLSPDDAEAKRILEFVSSYKTRPADMQLRIFISSLKDR